MAQQLSSARTAVILLFRKRLTESSWQMIRGQTSLLPSPASPLARQTPTHLLSTRLEHRAVRLRVLQVLTFCTKLSVQLLPPTTCSLQC